MKSCSLWTQRYTLLNVIQFSQHHWLPLALAMSHTLIKVWWWTSISLIYLKLLDINSHIFVSQPQWIIVSPICNHIDYITNLSYRVEPAIDRPLERYYFHFTMTVLEIHHHLFHKKTTKSSHTSNDKEVPWMVGRSLTTVKIIIT